MDTAKASSEAAVRRDAMLEALAFAAQRFLEQPSWVQSIDEILRRLGEAVGVSRAYVLENRSGEPPTTVLRSFWLAPGVTSPFQVGDELGFEDLERWVETLSRGEVLGGPVREFPASERRRLEPHGIRSVLLVPVVVSGTWWGYIGFDDCVDEREWPQVEIDVLRAAGGTLAAAIDRGPSGGQAPRGRSHLAPRARAGRRVGLALVARFTELMGGRAWVDESPAKGASFRVYLADGPRTSAEVGTAG